MTQPNFDSNAVPPEGYGPPTVPPSPGQQYPSGAQPQPPYQGQQYPYAGQPQPQPQPGYSAGPQQPYAGQPQYQGQQYPYAGQPQYPGHAPQPQYQGQPPMPNPAYGYAQPKSKVVAGLLGIFLGGLGIHRFYLGFTKIAVIQLVLTLVLGVFTFGIVGLWGVVEGIMIIAGSAYFRTDSNGVPLRD
ncbi:TM2 domain-containing protein [Arthrobacter sp. AL08]|uniref:TM2 domain-containing protein n=1 Tax=unclassified Arthrobacter TaxID=235627 RepID=UPI002499E301|nr:MULTISPECIES: TM2 domain-containing protein [unclassified Arthrobacter]MDI3243138.1 TM2 domain-containing protein [Arthrobacter sp. AL05]MDI3279122.1 TM2 domain-containing protein [Arthrobacter sp. AL08]